MERVAFLIQKTGARIRCMLNPESLTMSRRAGVRVRQSISGALNGKGMSDDPLLYTGGGVTELLLDLLFDVSISGSTIETQDVRELTKPFVQLTENSEDSDHYGCPPRVRFIWGKSWNIPGIVVAIAERLEDFTSNGEPRRSWLRMRFLRCEDSNEAIKNKKPSSANLNKSLDLPELNESRTDLFGKWKSNVPSDQIETHEIVGKSPNGERIDQIAYDFNGSPEWQQHAFFNEIDDPAHLEPGQPLQLTSFFEKVKESAQEML